MLGSVMEAIKDGNAGAGAQKEGEKYRGGHGAGRWGKWRETERDGKGKREGEGMVRREKI